MHLDNSPYLNGRPHQCNHCGNSLDRIRNVYRGAGSTRYYDSVDCLTKGEKLAAERELMRQAKLAGLVHMHWTATLAAILTVFMLVFIFGGGHRAYAHDPATHQADDLSDARSEAYGTCCVGDDYHKLRVEQWEPTDNGWRILYKGQWLDASRRTKVKNMPNPDGDAKVWIFNEETPYVRCFMPGAQG